MRLEQRKYNLRQRLNDARGTNSGNPRTIEMRPSILRLAGVAIILVIGISIGIFCRSDQLTSLSSTAKAVTIDASETMAASESRLSPPSTQQDVPRYSPVKARGRDFYAPNSEDLGPDEMRLVACGTGMPTARPKQAASCWLLELGNGDKFIFDIGTGSAERISALQIPYNYLDKLFHQSFAHRPLR
jgi:hypothetical protein